MVESRPGIRATATALREGRLSATELVRECIEAIATRDAAIGAFVHTDFDLALSQAAESDDRLARGAALGWLDGIPIAIKDNVDVEGMPTGNGTGRVVPARRDALLVARLRAAGAVFPGKTNLHEAALGTTTMNPHTGFTHNPHREGFIAGGSSGGSAAAVAAGFALGALGTDTMGSIRLPAAYCGVVGLKPTYDASMLDGVVPLYTPMDHIGPLCRDVSGAIALRSVLEAREEGVGEVAPSDLGTLRVGEFADHVATQLDADMARVVEHSVGEVHGQAAEIVRLDPLPHRPDVARRAALLLMERDLYERLGPGVLEDADTYSEAFRALVAYGARADAARVEQAREVVRSMRTAVRRSLAGVDIAISATAPQTAFAFEDAVPSDQADLVAAASLAGSPAISLPAGTAGNGLPVGLQLMAAPGRDEDLLRAALAVEALLARARPTG